MSEEPRTRAVRVEDHGHVRILTQPDLLAGRQFAEGRAAFLERRRPDFISA